MRSGCGSGGGSGRGERPAGRGWRARPMLNLGGVVITPELSARELVRVSRCWKAREKSVYQYRVHIGFTCDKEASKQWRTAVHVTQISKKEKLRTKRQSSY
ncbi:beta-1,3-galactosyltransferase 1 isoform X2 [Corapipo altera]|uniref:beta-1,3-galactosyltransferase 1 isoform X2 n=1 Tax=Corapipo altera TaxID=415028 RepID=UPI000FD690A9|nr:beta-1,3-galactosyltransferase 1 isoform X2 [Corapipo altera]